MIRLGGEERGDLIVPLLERGPEIVFSLLEVLAHLVDGEFVDTVTPTRFAHRPDHYEASEEEDRDRKHLFVGH